MNSTENGFGLFGPYSDWTDAWFCAVRDTKKSEQFDQKDIIEIMAKAEGSNDGDNWVAVFKLTGDRFGYLSSGCDYTGWGCQDWGTMGFRTTLNEVVRMLCTEEDRERLGFTLQTQCI